jgi:integrase
MPLRVIIRSDTGTLWIVGTVTPAGTKTGYRIRQRAGTDDEALAREEAAAIERQVIRNHHLGQRPIERGFAAALTAYCQAEPRSRQSIAQLQRLLRHFGNIPLRAIDQDALDDARKVLLQPDAAPGTVRRNLIVPLRAVLNHAHRRGWCDKPAFDVPAEPEGRTDFLMPDKVEAMLAAAGHIRPLLTYLVCTGCRVGEALALEWPQVDLRAGRVNVWGDQTKGGRRRIVTLTPGAVVGLGGLPHRDGHIVFRRGDGQPYRATGDGGGHIAGPWGIVCRQAGLPGMWQSWQRRDRQRGETRRFVPAFGVHVLRHTWASWWYALTPDPFALQREGGWSTVKLVERYAHLMPVGHEDAIRSIWGINGPIAERALTRG